MTPIQILAIQKSLFCILEQENGLDNSNNSKKNNKVIEAQKKEIDKKIKKLKGKGKTEVSLIELFGALGQKEK